MTTGKAERIFWIDAVRAFAILGIVYSHCAAFAGAPAPEWLGMFMGSASLFFMASGALVFPVRPSAGVFLRRRLASYVPQWIVFTVAYMVLMYFNDRPDPYRWSNLLRYGAMFGPWQGSWFLYALTGLYLFAPVLSPWLTTATRRSAGAFVALWVLSGFIPMIDAVAEVNPAEALLAPFFGFAGYMVAGYWLRRWPLSGVPVRRRVAFFALCALAVVGGLYFNIGASRWGYGQVFRYDLSFNLMAVNLAVFGAFSFLPSVSARPVCTAVSWLSGHSLTIYLWHLLLVRYIVAPVCLPGWAIFPIVLVLTLPLSAVTDRLFASLRKRAERRMRP